MKGDPAVIAALNEAYRLTKAIEEQAHIQEHWYENAGFKPVADFFDDIETHLHRNVIHPLMKRINAIGARVTPGYAFDIPSPYDVADLERACNDARDRLEQLRAAFGTACTAAERMDDYVTSKLLWGWMCFVEKRIRKFEKRIGKIRAVGLQPFLAELMD